MALVLITGASAGLGLAAAAALAAAGNDVVLHARDAGRFPGQGIHGRARGVIHGDLAKPGQAVGVARQANDIGRFDAVIHNAGVLDGPDVFAVNVVAPYVISAVMTPPRRLIVLSSSMHQTGSPTLDTVDFSRPGNRDRPYDDSKLYATALAMALAARRPETLTHAVDPGWVPTRMGGPSAPDDLDEGHRTQTWLATAVENLIKPRNGGYWHHHTPRRPHPAALDARFQQELLTKLETHTHLAIPR